MNDSAERLPAPRRPRPAPREPLAEGALAGVLGYRLALANAAMRQVFARRIGEPLGLRPVEFTVLQLLLVNRDVTQAQLARALAVSAPNLTTLLDRLVARGWVARERSDSDGRARHVRLTPAARKLARRAQELAGTMEVESLDHLSAAEQAMLAELLQKVIAGPGRRP